MSGLVDTCVSSEAGDTRNGHCPNRMTQDRDSVAHRGVGVLCEPLPQVPGTRPRRASTWPSVLGALRRTQLHPPFGVNCPQGNASFGGFCVNRGYEPKLLLRGRPKLAKNNRSRSTSGRPAPCARSLAPSTRRQSAALEFELSAPTYARRRTFGSCAVRAGSGSVLQ